MRSFERLLFRVAMLASVVSFVMTSGTVGWSSSTVEGAQFVALVLLGGALLAEAAQFFTSPNVRSANLALITLVVPLVCIDAGSMGGLGQFVSLAAIGLAIGIAVGEVFRKH